MTTEDDFQAQLDREPGDWQTRLVFADWLEERDDPRAEGYRALGVRRRRPWRRPVNTCWMWTHAQNYPHSHHGGADMLDRDWFERTSLATVNGWSFWTESKTRQLAEDAAALAFAKLPPNRRAELLAGV